MYDIAIIGAGPAGATFARLAGGKFKMVVLDKKPRTKKTQGFHKPCGGLLSPDAQKALSRFAQNLPRELLVDPQIFTVKTIDLPSGQVRHYQRFYLNLDRDRFDHWLMANVPETVDWVEGVCCDVQKTEAGYTLYYQSRGELRTLQAKYVVGADGGNSIVRRKLFPKHKMTTCVAIQQWFENLHKDAFYSCVFDPETSPYCSWALCKDDHFIFGGAFEKKDCRSAFEAQKEKLKRQGFCFGEPVKTEACILLRPSSPKEFCLGDKTAFLIGESAGFISPSSFEGISFALESARMLADSFAQSADPAARYRKKTLRLRFKLCLKILKAGILYNSFLRRLILKSGISTVKVTALPD